MNRGEVLAFIELSNVNGQRKVMIFVEGTILKPKSWLSLYNHKSYIPIGNAVSITKKWQKQGADIIYCTSCKGNKAEDIATLLIKYGFIGSKLYYRDKGQKYSRLVEEIKPNILIEDDCRSIGGSWQMCITYVQPEIKNIIKSVVVKEFKGIDHLPHELGEL